MISGKKLGGLCIKEELLDNMPLGVSVSIQNFFCKPIVQLLLIILSGGLVYSNTFDVPFVLDDYHVIVDNKKLANFSTFLTADLFPNPRWVALASFAINREFDGLNLFSFHAANLAIHLATGIVIYYLARTTLSSFGELSVKRYILAPVFASLAFALHPIHTQSVTYIVQRMTSLATFLYVLSLLLYAKAFLSEHPTSEKFCSSRYIPYGFAIISCLLAMTTKEISFTLPMVLALYDVCFLTGRLKERFLRLIPFVVCMLVLALYLVGMERGISAINHGGGDDVSYGPPHLTYIFTELSVLCTYLRLLVLPVAQNLDYDYPIFSSLFHPQVLAALSFLLIFLCGGIFLLKKSYNSMCHFPEIIRISGFAIIWFFVTISVESGFVPLIDSIFEHRVYLPSIWFFVAFGMLVNVLYNSAITNKKVVMIAVITILVALGYATYLRNHVWRDPVRLWSDVISKSPDKVRGWVMLGVQYVNKLDPVNAVPLLEHSISLNPDYYPAHIWLGRALVQQGNDERALKHYLVATRLAPNYPKGWETAGRLLLEQGQEKVAVVYLNKALELDPVGFSSHGYLRKALMFEGR